MGPSLAVPAPRSCSRPLVLQEEQRALSWGRGTRLSIGGGGITHPTSHWHGCGLAAPHLLGVPVPQDAARCAQHQPRRLLRRRACSWGPLPAWPPLAVRLHAAHGQVLVLVGLGMEGVKCLPPTLPLRPPHSPRPAALPQGRSVPKAAPHRGLLPWEGFPKASAALGPPRGGCQAGPALAAAMPGPGTLPGGASIARKFTGAGPPREEMWRRRKRKRRRGEVSTASAKTQPWQKSLQQ